MKSSLKILRNYSKYVFHRFFFGNSVNVHNYRWSRNKILCIKIDSILKRGEVEGLKKPITKEKWREGGAILKINLKKHLIRLSVRSHATQYFQGYDNIKKTKYK